MEYMVRRLATGTRTKYPTVTEAIIATIAIMWWDKSNAPATSYVLDADGIVATIRSKTGADGEMIITVTEAPRHRGVDRRHDPCYTQGAFKRAPETITLKGLDHGEERQGPGDPSRGDPDRGDPSAS